MNATQLSDGSIHSVTVDTEVTGEVCRVVLNLQTGGAVVQLAFAVDDASALAALLTEAAAG